MSEKLREALDDAIRELSRYRGEEIRKDEHPLHTAIQRLEALCRPRHLYNPPRGQDKLFLNASKWWFWCLWASRPGQSNVPPSAIHDPVTRGRGRSLTESSEARPDLAHYWAGVLLNELTLWKVNPDYLERLFERERPRQKDER